MFQNFRTQPLEDLGVHAQKIHGERQSCSRLGEQEIQHYNDGVDLRRKAHGVSARNQDVERFVVEHNRI